MRQLMLKRLEAIRRDTKGFPRNTMRWERFTVHNVHVSEVNFSELNDSDLVANFERVIKRNFAQM